MCLRSYLALEANNSNTQQENGLNGGARKAQCEKLELICNQCVFNVYLRSYQALEANTSQISTRQWTTQVVPDQLNVKTMILIFFQCVFNVFSMCIQDHIKLWKLKIVRF